jgi:anthranilate synthase component 1
LRAMNITSFDTFKELARRGTFVPVCKELVADLLTPVSAFLKIAEHSDYAFLLESVEGGEHVGRYSFLGKDPFLILRSRDGRTTIERGGVTTESDRSFIDTLRRLMADFRSPFVADLPRFTGGAVGFLGYGASSWFEPVLGDLGASDDGADEAGFMLFDTVLAFDHVQHRILIIANARITADDDLESLYQFACAKIQFLERELERSLSRKRTAAGNSVEVRSNYTQAKFEEQVRAAKEHIAAGDIYQVVLSQRFEADVAADPFTVYRALRHVNPSPYMYFIRMGGVSIVGSSPEMLVRVEGSRVETHPIAGTRPRGRNADEDMRLAEELKRNEKERAEHVMLVDLGRNDVGRVCEFGSVRVPQFMGLERFSHVMHLTSIVEGKLADDRDRLDALVSCFPAGTVSGAPKVRAMQIINELEPSGRGIYAGAVGYVDFAGNLDFCIAIRTVIMSRGKAYVQAGAGIVIDSNPTAEFEETRAKARALLRALELAQEGL